MSNKPDPSIKKIRQPEAGQRGTSEVSRPASGTNKPAGSPADRGWPELQSLRRNLKVLSDPIPTAVKQIFGLENKFRHLDVKPRAAAVPGLDQSVTLNQNVEALTFSEEALIQGAHSKAKPAFLASAPTFTADGHEQQAGPGRSMTNPKPERVGGGRSPKEANDSDLSRETEGATIGNTTDRNGHVNSASEVAADVSLAPESLRLWIDDILRAEKQGVDKPRKARRSAMRPEKATAAPSLPRDASGLRRVNTSDAISATYPTPAPANRKKPAGSRSGLKSKPDNSGLGSAQLSSQASKGKLESTAKRENAIKHSKRPGPSRHASATTDAQVFEGIALLQQLVQMEKPGGLGDPVRPGKPSTPGPASVIADGRARLASNTAWQQLEKSLRSTPSDVRGDASNPTTPSPVAAVAEMRDSGHQEESERVAALVNEALIEQAIRHGLDLS